MDSAAEVLTARGPLTEDQLLAELRDRGVDLGEIPAETLEDAFDDAPAPAVLLTDERWAWLPSLLAGRTFTHPMTEAEVAHDLLFLTPDLAPAEPLFEGDDTRLSDGTQVQLLVLPFAADLLGERGVLVDDIPDGTVLMLPIGYLSGRNIRPVDLIGLQVTADGPSLDVVELTDQAAATAELAQALATVLERRQPEELDAAIWTACADQSELFRNPLPPLEEILPACGLVRDVDRVAREGFDFAGWSTDLRRDVVMHRYDLTEDEALTVLAATALFEQVSELYDAATQAADDPLSLNALFDELAIGPEAEPPGEAAEFRATMKDVLTYLDEPLVALALLDQTTGYDATRAAPLGLFAETLEPLMPRSIRPALRWLRAKAHELLGEVATAEQLLL
ncbi:MAG TPA: hypothetical protein VMT27_04870, partial [Actinomycetes bacterium]|nr:hypothetical protein [Actinomycetes bacterium]